MSEYEFVTEWRLAAPIGPVWDAIERVEEWPEWWPGVVRVELLRDGDASGIGSLRRMVWKSALPYKLAFDTEVTAVDRHRLIEARADGQLTGVGLWTFDAVSDCETHVWYDWHVRTTKPWMNRLAPVARPLFRWNHDKVMANGEAGLRAKLRIAS